MSYKILLILSMVFVSLFFLFAGDMVSLQFAYSNLDATSITISHIISESLSVNDQLINKIETKYNVDFTLLNEEEPLFGDVVDFVISTHYQSIVLSNNAMLISVKRSTVLGYYN